MKTRQRFNLISSEVSCVSASCEPAEEQQLMKNLWTLAATNCDSPYRRLVSADIGRIRAQIPDSLPPEPSFAVAFTRGLIAWDSLGFRHANCFIILSSSSFSVFLKKKILCHFVFVSFTHKTRLLITRPASFCCPILPRLLRKHNTNTRQVKH